MNGTVHRGLVACQYGLAAGLACAISGVFVPADRLSATFVALMCVQPSWRSSTRQGIEQLVASALGAGTTLVVLLFLPNRALAVGLGVALTYLLSQRLRYGPSAMIVALFSALYMTILAQETVWETLWLRGESVALGVAVGVIINMLFLRWVRRPYLTQARQRGLSILAVQCASLARALSSGDMTALRQAPHSLKSALSELDMWHQDVLDARHDPDAGAGAIRSMALNALLGIQAGQNALRHLLDVVTAATALTGVAQSETGEDVALWDCLTESLRAGRAIIDSLQAGDLATTARDLAAEQGRLKAFDLSLLPPVAVQERLGPRIALLVALMQFHNALASLTALLRDQEWTGLTLEESIATPL